MTFIDLRKHRILIVVAMIILLFSVVVFNTNWVFKIIYPIHYKELIDKYANQYDLDPYLVIAIMRTESKFHEKAKSHKDAKGLMQIAPITGAWAAKELKFSSYDQETLYNPDKNIQIGCWYLSKLKNEFDGKIQIIIAAYNAGSGNVGKWLKNAEYSDGETLKEIPFPETKAYVKKVIRSYKIYKIIYK